MFISILILSRQMYILSACFSLTVPGQNMHSSALIWSSLAVCLFVVISALVYMNTGKRYKK